MAGPSDRNWDMTSHPVLDTIPSYGITKSEWRERVEATGRPYTDPFVIQHTTKSDLASGAINIGEIGAE